MKNTIRASIVQMDIARFDVKMNRERIHGYMDRAANEGTEFILFPELATTGYVEPRDPMFGRELYEHSEDLNGETVNELAQSAKRLGLYVLFGMALRHPTVSGSLFNSAILLTPEGTVGGVQHKIHLPGEEKHYFYSGNSIEVFNTALGRISCATCYDLRFPEVSRVAALKGSEIQCSIINGALHSHKGRPYSAQRFKHWAVTRACENGNYVLACNRVGRQGTSVFCGNSAIAGPTGMLIAESHSSTDEEVISAVLQAQEIIDERMYRPVFPDRRPDLYSAIADRSQPCTIQQEGFA